MNGRGLVLVLEIKQIWIFGVRTKVTNLDSLHHAALQLANLGKMTVTMNLSAFVAWQGEV